MPTDGEDALARLRSTTWTSATSASAEHQFDHSAQPPVRRQHLSARHGRCDHPGMVPVLLGAGLVIGVVVVVKALQSRGDHAPAPPDPPPDETPISDAGVPGGAP
jgi:hypothetical protein